jgi:hypothetical protein
MKTKNEKSQFVKLNEHKTLKLYNFDNMANHG